MRLVLPISVKAGRNYKIIQRYYNGTVITFEGRCTHDGDLDEYVWLVSAPRINCHSYVGMDVEVWEL